MSGPHPQTWLKTTPAGLYCEPGGFHIDPSRAVDKAVITHGHGDHARAGHGSVLATPGTLAIMRTRYGADCAGVLQALDYGERLKIGPVELSLAPAGHILGSAQIVLEYKGSRAVVSGDFKRRADRTCLPFAPVNCDVFVTEATFGLPVFRHPPDRDEIARLLHSLRTFPERTHTVGVYALGKCQRVLTLLRAADYHDPVWLHGALVPLTETYRALGVDMGETIPVSQAEKGEDFAGRIVLCPPSALGDRWTRRFAEPLPVAASGWMRVRARARQGNAELPLIISDHADWDELLQTVEDVDAPEVWITHGREEALIHAISATGRRARALSLVGREDEEN